MGRDITLGSIRFDCRGKGRVLRNVGLAVPHNGALTLINPAKSNGAAAVGLFDHFCSISDNAIRFSKASIQGFSLSSIEGRVKVILRSSVLFAKAVTSGVQFNGPSTAVRRIESTTRGTRVTSFVRDLPSNCRAGVDSRRSLFSGKRGRLVDVTQALLDSPRFLILSRTASGISAIARRGVRGTVSVIVRNHADFIVTRHLGAVIGTSRVTILGSNDIVRRKDRRRLLTGNNFCRGLCMGRVILSWNGI